MPDYQRDYDLARMAAAAYEPGGEIIKSMRQPNAAQRLLPDGWSVLSGSHVENSPSGFSAITFVNEKTKEMVIAYRGSEGNAASGFANPFNYADRTTYNDWRGPDVALGKPGAAWHPQFTEALDYAKGIVDRYSDRYQLSVTGHSLGGSLAQVAGAGLQLPGRTFDPAGAANIVQAPEFAAWLKANNPGAHPAAPDFTNYCVNGSVVSGKSGAHVGQVTAISGTSGAANPNDSVGQIERHDYHRITWLMRKAAMSGALDQHDDPSRAEGLRRQHGTSDLPAGVNPLYTQALEGVNGLGLGGDQRALAGALAVQAQAQGMTRIDEVAASRDGNGVFAMQSNPDNALDVRRAHVDREQAASQPLEQNLARLELASATNAELTQEPQPAQRGPAMA